MTTTTTIAKAEFLASKPSWAKRALIAQFETDQCDGMTDYYATSTERTVFLGWSVSDRDNFKDMRSAALRFSETAFLATAPKSAEHREKYSMGAGYYLKATGRYSTGWKVRKAGDWAFYGDTVEVLDAPAPVTAPAAPVAAPLATGVTGVTMTLNVEKNGVELRFPAKPSDDVRANLKANGWRWSSFSSCWYRKQSPQALTFASALVQGVERVDISLQAHVE